MNSRKRVTIKQVAKESGVSTQTVSRVINNRPDVAQETRRRVQAVIKRLGYQPSQAARSLSRGLSYTLGVVAYGIEYFGPSRALSGVEGQAAELGYSPLLYLVREPGSNDVARIIDDLLSRHADGIIWAVPEIGGNRDWIVTQFDNLPVPAVFHSMGPRSGLTTVCVDNYLGGRLATQHLIDQGYRHIGLITGPMDWWEARERARGWHDAIVGAGLSGSDPDETSSQPDQNLIVYGSWEAASGEAGLNQLREQRPDVEAIFVSNDQMALGVMQTARKCGLRIPQDLAIVGFDDIPEAAYFWPPLTTVSQPLYDVGRSSVAELTRMIEISHQGITTAESKTIMLQPELIVRQSSTKDETTGISHVQVSSARSQKE
ncbi:MAG: LacI family DNA-binding transcriptional regulator [Chloroflexota bacterium]